MKSYSDRCRDLGEGIYWFTDSQSEDIAPLPPLQAAHLQVNTDLNALMDVLAWFDQFNHPPIPFQTWLQCQLALAEGFTNAVRHAHRGQADLAIDLEVKLFSERLEIQVWDRGEPFDLFQTLKGMPAQVDPAAEGGRGLKLMQKIADFLSYVRTPDNRNCLLIVKHYPISE